MALGSSIDGRRLSKPIRFPWTVSVTDPLLLTIIGTTTKCYCTWTADISWMSGSSTGTIKADNDGHGYRVTAGRGLQGYYYDGSRWRSG